MKYVAYAFLAAFLAMGVYGAIPDSAEGWYTPSGGFSRQSGSGTVYWWEDGSEQSTPVSVDSKGVATGGIDIPEGLTDLKTAYEALVKALEANARNDRNEEMLGLITKELTLQGDEITALADRLAALNIPASGDYATPADIAALQATLQSILANSGVYVEQADFAALASAVAAIKSCTCDQAATSAAISSAASAAQNAANKADAASATAAGAATLAANANMAAQAASSMATSAATAAAGAAADAASAKANSQSALSLANSAAVNAESALVAASSAQEAVGNVQSSMNAIAAVDSRLTALAAEVESAISERVPEATILNALDTVTNAANSVASSVGALSSRVESLEGTVAGHTTQIAALNQTVAGHTAQLATLSSETAQALTASAEAKTDAALARAQATLAAQEAASASANVATNLAAVVKTVNGEAPDQTGNVEIDVPPAYDDTELERRVAALEAASGGGGSSGGVSPAIGRNPSKYAWQNVSITDAVSTAGQWRDVTEDGRVVVHTNGVDTHNDYPALAACPLAHPQGDVASSAATRWQHTNGDEIHEGRIEDCAKPHTY